MLFSNSSFLDWLSFSNLLSDVKFIELSSLSFISLKDFLSSSRLITFKFSENKLPLFLKFIIYIDKYTKQNNCTLLALLPGYWKSRDNKYGRIGINDRSVSYGRMPYLFINRYFIIYTGDILSTL